MLLSFIEILIKTVKTVAKCTYYGANLITLAKILPNELTSVEKMLKTDFFLKE